MSIKPHLNGAFGSIGFLDLAILFMEEIWHDVQKGTGSILISISSQKLAVSPANNDLVDLWPNLWCKSYKAIPFRYGNFFVFDISFIFPNNACSFVNYVVM